MRRQWNSMANHTLFKSWNTKEFQNMENALNRFLTAYDNVMAGKTADGKEFRADTSETLTGATEQQKNTNARRKLTAKVTKLDNAARHR